MNGFYLSKTLVTQLTTLTKRKPPDSTARLLDNYPALATESIAAGMARSFLWCIASSLLPNSKPVTTFHQELCLFTGKTILKSTWPSSPASPSWSIRPGCFSAIWWFRHHFCRRFFSLCVHWLSEPKVHRDGCRQRTHIMPPALGNEQHVSRSKDSLHKMSISKMGMDLTITQEVPWPII